MKATILSICIGFFLVIVLGVILLARILEDDD